MEAGINTIICPNCKHEFSVENELSKKLEASFINEFSKKEAALKNELNIKWKEEQDKDKYSEEEMVNFAEFVATYADKNRNVNGEMLHAKSKYDGAERTIDLLEKWFEQFKKK